MQKHITKVAAKLVNAPLKPARPERFTYALAAYTAERRKDGWWIGKTVPTFSEERQKWSGPFIDIENACLSIARQLFVEVADRHTRSIEAHKIGKSDPLYGLKPTTKLRAR